MGWRREFLERNRLSQHWRVGRGNLDDDGPECARAGSLPNGRRGHAGCYPYLCTRDDFRRALRCIGRTCCSRRALVWRAPSIIKFFSAEEIAFAVVVEQEAAG